MRKIFTGCNVKRISDHKRAVELSNLHSTLLPKKTSHLNQEAVLIFVYFE